MWHVRFVGVLAIVTAIVAAACSSSKPSSSDAGADAAHDAGKKPVDAGKPKTDGSTTTLPDGATVVTEPDGDVVVVDDGGGQDDDGGDSVDADIDTNPPTAPLGPGGPTCETALQIAEGVTNLTLVASMDAGTNAIALPCATDGGITSEVFFSFQFSSTVFFYADTFGAGWNTALFLLSESCQPITASTMPGDAVCNDDACGTTQSQIVALLVPGHYVLGVASKGEASGAANVRLQFAVAASGVQSKLAKGMSVHTGATSGETGNIQGESNACEADGPEDGFWWTNCPADPGGELTASTCDGGTAWESVIETEIPGLLPYYTCTVDGCYPGTSFSEVVPAGAGLRAIFIDGETGGAGGTYTMTVNRP